MSETKPKTLVREHIDRCIECYGMDIETKARRVDRDRYEAMRADLMLAVGMLMALDPPTPGGTNGQ